MRVLAYLGAVAGGAILVSGLGSSAVSCRPGQQKPFCRLHDWSRDPSPHALAEAHEAVRAARAEYTATTRRPSGINRRDRAYFEMFSEMDQVIELLQNPFPSSEATVRPSTEEGDRLRAAILDALHASAAVLHGGAAPDLNAVDRARRDHRSTLDAWVIAQL